MSLSQLIGEYEDHSHKLNWSGALAEYLQMVEKFPRITRLSHARVYDMIMTYGVEKDAEGKIKHYRFFDGEIFGSQRPLHDLVEYFKAGAHGLEVRKRILLLMGPAGGGKSSIVSLLKRRLEAYSRTDEGALYGIAGCPMHEEPLHLLPESLRKTVRDQYGVYIEGDLCPVCNWRLLNEWDGDFRKAKVERVLFTEMGRKGVGTFSPSDPKTQDVGELIGSMDLAKIGEIGSESDPRAWRFDGELNIANRGIMEFIELLKCLTPDTVLFTDQGVLRLADFIDPDQPTNSFAPKTVTLATGAGVETTSHIFRSGHGPIRTLTTRYGYRLSGTPQHRILVRTPDEQTRWTTLADIKLGDHVCIQRGADLWGPPHKITWRPNENGHGNLKAISIPAEVTPHMARLIGMLIADGCLAGDKGVSYCKMEPDMVEEVRLLFQEYFGLDLKMAGPRQWRVHSTLLVEFFESVGVRLGCGAAKKTVPVSILRSPKEVVREYLRGYFAGDGCAQKNGRIEAASASEELARMHHMLLLNFGILAQLGTMEQQLEGWTEPRTYWVVAMDSDNADKFMSEIGMASQRKTATYLEAVDGLERTARQDVLPHFAAAWSGYKAALTEKIKSNNENRYVPYRQREGLRQAMGDKAYTQLWRLSTGRVDASHQTATAVLEVGDELGLDVPPEILEAMNSGIFFDQVEDITEGEAETWDWTVPGSHSFIGNGFINHNCDAKFLYLLLNLAQEQRIKAPRYPLIYADEIVISHTNEAEFQRFLGEKTNEALQDRMHVVKVPYNLAASDEEKIHDKLLRQGSIKVHLAPHTTKVAAMFGVLTRLEDVESKKKLSLTDKLKLYDGQKLENWTEHEVRTLHDESPREGMDGAGPRFIVDALSKALAAPDSQCLDPVAALRGIMDHLDHHPHIDAKRKEVYKNHVGRVRDVYHDLLKKQVMSAFVTGFQEQAKAMVGQYLVEVNAWRKKDKIMDPVTRNPRDPDEKLMRAIEEQQGVSETAKIEFRNEIVARVADLALNGKTFDYTSHDRLREAVERKLFGDVKAVVKTVVSAQVLDKDQQARVDQVIETLKSQNYCEYCARSTLQYLSRIID